MVEKVMSSNEAKQRWGEVMRTVETPKDVVIVESHGKPKVAVISYDQYTRMVELERTQPRERAIRELEATYDDRNNDLSPEQIEGLADKFSREFVEDLAREGKIRFRSDTRQ